MKFNPIIPIWFGEILEKTPIHILEKEYPMVLELLDKTDF